MYVAPESNVLYALNAVAETSGETPVETTVTTRSDTLPEDVWE